MPDAGATRLFGAPSAPERMPLPHRPIPELAAFIDCFWVLKASAIPGVTPRVRMPADGRATMLLSFAGDFRFVAENGSTSRLSSGTDLIAAGSQRPDIRRVMTALNAVKGS